MTKAARDLPPYSRKPNKPRDFEEKVVDDSTGITTYAFTSKRNGETYKVKDDKGGAVFDCLLSFTSKDANIEVVYELTSLPEGIIPFARDPFWGLICFNYCDTKDCPSVVFYDQESVNEDKIKLICDSFSELIERLYSD
ncbi:SMI1/KNR4 family protein [Bacillus sp. SH5-2]|uniref:SMI1/KNR4 family protein n=1 Tax=Bacillus sp. SH5-2 TaxID=2217834 RepID=UPI00351A2658